MRKRKNIFNKSIVGIELSIILLSAFAFAFILSEINLIGAIRPIFLPKGELSNPPPVSLDPVTPTSASSSLSKFFGVKEVGGTADALLTGLQWAAVAYGVGQLIGGLLGLESQNVDALATSLAAGARV